MQQTILATTRYGLRIGVCYASACVAHRHALLIVFVYCVRVQVVLNQPLLFANDASKSSANRLQPVATYMYTKRHRANPTLPIATPVCDEGRLFPLPRPLTGTPVHRHTCTPQTSLTSASTVAVVSTGTALPWEMPVLPQLHPPARRCLTYNLFLTRSPCL